MQTTFDVNSYIANFDRCFFSLFTLLGQSLSIIIRPDEPFIVISFSNVYFGLSLQRKIMIATEVHFVRT